MNVPTLLVVAQALLSNPISAAGEPPGLRYYDTGQQAMDFVIQFRIDSELLARSSVDQYSCGWTPSGIWLYDRHPDFQETGRWMITMSRDGDLCFRDMPDQRVDSSLEFSNLEPDVCHTLRASHEDGFLTVSVNGETQRRRTTLRNPTYQSGPNGIGVGREINGYHNPWGNDSFPGEISYVRDGELLPLRIGAVTGNASLGDGECPGVPEAPPPGPCDLDPDGLACACETNPHPACNACLAP